MSENGARSGTQARKYTEQIRIPPDVKARARVEAGDKPLNHYITEVLERAFDQVVFLLQADAYDDLKRDSKRKKIKMEILGSNYVSQGVRADIYDPDYVDKIKERQNAFEFLMLCPEHLGWDETNYVCVFIRIGKTPEIKILGKTEIEARTICDICIKDARASERDEDACIGLVLIDENWSCVRGSTSGTVRIKSLGKDYPEICGACKKTLNLEVRWKEILSKDKHGFEKHTYCKDGGYFDDKTGRIKCAKQGVWQNQSVCFVMWKGKPCPSLKTLPARPIKKTGVKRRARR